MPSAPLAGGSQTTASIHPAALDACMLLRKELTALAIVDQDSKLIGRNLDEIGYGNGRVFVRSQIIGGVIFGIGAALMEATEYDKRWGNPVTRTLADYHVPVHLDVPPIDVHFIGKPDPHISPIGARGIGEIGITGVSAAIANAVFNATGKRLRDLPLTPEKFFEV